MYGVATRSWECKRLTFITITIRGTFLGTEISLAPVSSNFRVPSLILSSGCLYGVRHVHMSSSFRFSLSSHTSSQ